MRPGELGESHPADAIVEVAPALDIGDVHGLPVGATLSERVGEQPGIRRGGKGHQRGRAVWRERVGIEDEDRLETRFAEINGRLLLQAGVPLVEEPAGLDHRYRHLRVVPQGSDAIAEVRPQRQRLEIPFGHEVLLVDPPADIGRLEVFHPAIRVGDRAAVILVDGIATARFGIVH